MPKEVITRAKDVLGTLAVHQHGDGGMSAGDRSNRSDTANETNEKHDAAKGGRKKGRVDVSGVASADAGGQMALFKEYVPHPAVDALKELKLDAMTPLQAFDALRRLQEKALDCT